MLLKEALDPGPAPVKKARRKKKKSKYQEMMAGITSGTKNAPDANSSAAEREQFDRQMRRGLGGGQFSKIDRI